DPADAAKRIAEHWRDAEAAHDARRELADYLVNRLRGKRSVMYEVATREIPERSLLCLKRNVEEQEMWAFGKEFIAILRERPLPKIEGREGAMLCIWWGLVNDDGNGPIEWCMPVPAAQAESLAPHYPELTLRTEPAHLEAFVALPDAGDAVAHWQLAAGSLEAWAEEPKPEHEGDRLALTPADLGLRITYLASALGTEEPYCDMALPFAVEP
ncbi:MAG: hypothetical protein ABSB76_14600, partial [Streptosporangiaceae bacterium]